MLAIKLATMVFAWDLAMLIAPLGLGWLSWHHRRAA